VTSRHVVAGAFEGTAVASDGGFVVVEQRQVEDSSRVVRAIRPTGETRWATKLPAPERPDGGFDGWRLGGDDHIVVVQMGSGGLIGLDAASGAQVWRSQAPDGQPQLASDGRLHAGEVVIPGGRPRGRSSSDAEQAWFLALDTRSGAVRQVATLDAQPRHLGHGLSQSGIVRASSFTRAGNELWIVGNFGGRLRVAGAAVEVDGVKAQRYSELCESMICVDRPATATWLSADGYVIVGGHWEMFIARVPLASRP